MKALSIVTGPFIVISCAMSAGSQQARRGGTSQRLRRRHADGAARGIELAAQMRCAGKVEPAG